MLQNNQVPRIATVSVDPSADRKALLVSWKGGGRDEIDLSGWIASGGDLLVQLDNPETFRKAKVVNYGSAIAWDDGDLTIDAVQLSILADVPKR